MAFDSQSVKNAQTRASYYSDKSKHTRHPEYFGSKVKQHPRGMKVMYEEKVYYSKIGMGIKVQLELSLDSDMDFGSASGSVRVWVLGFNVKNT